MDKKKILVIGIAAGLAALILITVGVLFLFPGQAGAEAVKSSGPEETKDAALIRRNTMSIAREYMEEGQYERALDLLDKLLIGDVADEEVRTLRNEVLRKHRDALAAAEASRSSETSRSPEAQPSLEEIASMLRRQETEAALTAAAETERRAEAEAETARRKAQEEELSRKSRELQDRMKAVNDLLSQGKDRLRKGDRRGAEEAFTEALERMPEGERRFEGQILADMGEAYYEAYAREPKNRDGALSAEAQDALDRAVKHSRSATERDPSQSLPHYTLGKINRDIGHMDDAAAEIKEAVRLEPNNYIYSLELGRIHFSTKKFADARQAFEAVTRLNPQFESGWYNLGGTLRQLGRQDEALGAYRRAVEVKPDYTAAHREIGRILAAKKDTRGAVEAFNQALKFSPSDTASLRELGAVQSAAGDYAAAESSFNRVLQTDSGDLQTNYNLAVVKLAQGKNAEALSYAKKAAEGAVPANAVYTYTLGLALEAADDTGGAITAYTRAAALDPRYVRPRVNLGRLYLDNGFPREALNFLLEALKTEPSSFEVNNNLGAVYAKLENWTASVDHYKKALAQEANNAAVHLSLARALAGAGELDRAREAYLESVRIAPDNLEALMELGKTCVSLGDTNGAKRYFQDLISRNPTAPLKAEAEKILVGL